MTQPIERILLQRILVGLNSSRPSRDALRTAAKLALLLRAELKGLYVEDDNLDRLARLPFAQEIRYPDAKASRLDTAVMTHQLQQVAARARSELREEAERRGLKWSFSVSRGSVTDNLLTAGDDADLLVLGKQGRRHQFATTPGSTASQIALLSRSPVLLMDSQTDLRRPMLLYYDHSHTSQRALAVTIPLAQLQNELYVLLSAPDRETAQHYRASIRQQLEGSGIRLVFHIVRRPEELTGLTRYFDLGLVAVGVETGNRWEAIVNNLLQLNCSVLLVRQAAQPIEA